MSVNPDIHDKAYQFFIEEAAELLQIIEDGILELRRDRGANTVHAVMRAAHSIKGGAASVELEAIKSIAHRMETAFRALYDETVEIDDELEGLLLDGFDCLKDPLNEQIETGNHDPEAALSTAMPIIEALEEKLGADALKQADSFIPSSSDLGIDMVTSIFEMDVEEGIAHLAEVAANPGGFPVLGELQAQAEVFVGFGELLDLPGFGRLGQAILDACHNNPADPVALLTIALQDLEAAKELVMGGDRDQGGAPSEALLALAGGGSEAAPASAAPEAELSGGDFADFGLSEVDLANFDFGNPDFANVDLSALSADSALSDINASEPSALDDGLTDAGLGDLDLNALTLEGESLLGDAEMEYIPSASDEVSALEDNEAQGFELGAADFQALIDESGSVDLGTAEDEFATVEQGSANDVMLNLEDPIVAELDAPQDEIPALDSLDAMAQLASLMAEPDSSDASESEASESGASESGASEPGTSESELFDFEAPAADAAEMPAVEEDNAPAIADEDEVFASFDEASEPWDDAPATEESVDSSEQGSVDIAAPDAELENMWAELDDDLGDGLLDGSGSTIDVAEDSDLDSAFEIAMDRADEAEDQPAEPSLDRSDLADIFAEDSVALPAEQDVTTALSVAEADAAFEAMVDASAADNSDDFLDPETSLDLSFDDEPAASEALSNSEFQEIFPLDAPEDETFEDKAPAEELVTATAAPSEAEVSESQPPAIQAAEIEPAEIEPAETQSSEARLIDPWVSLAMEESTMPEAERAESSTEATVERADAVDEDSPAVADEQLADVFDNPEESDSASEELTAEPTLEPVTDVGSEEGAELIDEGTFVQGLEMGTFVQSMEADSESLRDAIASEASDAQPMADESAPSESFDEGTFIQAFEEGTFIQAIPSDSSEVEAVEQPSVLEESFEEGTYVQNIDEGTFVQEMFDAASDSSEVEAVEQPSVLEESFEEGTYVQDIDEGTFVQEMFDAASDSSEVKAVEQPSIQEESIEEGTYVQDIDEGTFVQEMSDAVSESSEAGLLNQPPVLEESFDEGTFVQGIEEGTFVQEMSDAAEPSTQASLEAEGAWGDSVAEDSGTAEEALIPELQAFIAQAAAESANPNNAEAGGSGEAELELPEASEPPAGDELESGQPHVQPEAEVAAEVADPEPPTPSDEASQSKSDRGLPSLETMFSVGPERLAAIANDSLASELMGEAELETIKSIQNSVPTDESTVVEAATVAEIGNSNHAADPAVVEPTLSPETADAEPDAAASDAIAQPGDNPLTPTAVEVALAEHQAVEPVVTNNPESSGKAARINNAVQAVEQLFGQLPTNNQLPTAKPAAAPQTPEAESKETKKAAKKKRQQGTKLSGISVRVDLSVLERMNNLVGELVLSRNSLSLQHEQLQSVVTQLDKRFNNFEGQLNGLRGISDQMLVEPAQRQAAGQAASQSAGSSGAIASSPEAQSEADSLLEGFDVLEMDRYSALHGQLQEIFEQLMQLEEGVDDIGVLLEQSTQSLTQQRQRLGLLQNELMWARMLPLDNILGRFPRVLRDMSRKHGKSVDLNMNGTSVLVDKGMLEKLHDPMLHLLRNAFDHGIEKPEDRKEQGKSERAEIQINAYYQGNQTVIEIKDDGQGVNLERIAKRAVELEWLSREEVKSVPQQALLDLIFEPGFSTAAKLSELSGRGVGLDVVREQLKGLKGSVTVDFEKGEGTTFTLRLPLTLTVAKLMVCQVGTTAIALPSDGIEDLLVPQPEQLKMVGNKRLLHWRDDLIPIHSMAELLDYSCPTADLASLKSITSKSIPVPKDWALPLLIFSRGSQRCAMEVNRLLMEQELVIKPFSAAMTPPEYSYGCTILGDGRMIPVLDGTALLQQLSNHSMAMAAGVDLSDESLDEEERGDRAETAATMAQAMQADTILVVDDSTAMRRTMALSLEKAGYRVLQAGDGQEALTQLRQSSAIQLVICDVEMPNMNGFEFLSQRRREPMLMKTPVVMLTSRSSDKHRRLAMQLKAHDYFSKPYVEQDFLKSIKQILASQGAAAKV